MGKSVLDPYHFSFRKRSFDLFFSVMGVILFSPIFLFLLLIIMIFSGFPVFFVQKRTGLNGKSFNIFKFRTMKNGAQRNQYKYKKLNEADGPVFKIHNDPRFTKIGKILSRTGLDELPQLFNVIRGEMSFVGPRPLPIYESRKLNRIQKTREMIKPGITSPWVVKGSHSLSFKEWMNLDTEYLKKASLKQDIKIIISTLSILYR